eukprot:jgi/Mesvir1/17170/Mv07592-RA.1
MAETAERMTLPPRATRGMRMTKLMAEEQQADEEFWNQAALAEEEDDREYSTEESVGDEFDSDFNDTEDDENDDEVEAENEGRRTRRLRPPEPKKPAKAGVRPGRAGGAPAADSEGDKGKGKGVARGRGAALQRSSSGGTPGSERPSKRVRFADGAEGDAGGSTGDAGATTPTDNRDANGALVPGGGAEGSGAGLARQPPRKSQRTVVVEKDAERERLRALESVASKAPRKPLAPVTEHRMTQEEMLLEAAQTEILNQQSLESLLAMEEAIKKKATVHKAVYEGPRVRFLSKNGRDVVEFIKMDRLPAAVASGPVSYPEKPICPVTGMIARWETEFSPSSVKAKEKRKSDGLPLPSASLAMPSATSMQTLSNMQAVSGGTRIDGDVPMGHIPVPDISPSSSQYVLAHKPTPAQGHQPSLAAQPARSSYVALDPRPGGGLSQAGGRPQGGTHAMLLSPTGRAGMSGAPAAAAAGTRTSFETAVPGGGDGGKGEISLGTFVPIAPNEPPVMHLGGTSPQAASKYVI